ncbi:hypothetical protein [Acidovorax sp. Leaf160]|uniref:hypothetical protein n=1 Tax=Acidovorax sp. Leaf160 TaxID=1736280 RepID=UPI000A484FE2|nr:hypothetical protein [Acidovorax sp. Leaf160]
MFCTVNRIIMVAGSPQEIEVDLEADRRLLSLRIARQSLQEAFGTGTDFVSIVNIVHARRTVLGMAALEAAKENAEGIIFLNEHSIREAYLRNFLTGDLVH